MVKFLLMIGADLINVATIEPQGGCDDSEFTYYFKLQCVKCQAIAEKETCLSLDQIVPSAKGQAYVHLSQKCKDCGAYGTITMIPGCGSSLTQGHADAGKYAALMLFDCRGFQPLDYAFSRGWKVVSTEGNVFESVDLLEGVFSEYDEGAICQVDVFNLRSKFTVVK